MPAGQPNCPHGSTAESHSREEYTRETTLTFGESAVYDELAVVEIWKHPVGRYLTWSVEVYPADNALRNQSSRIFSDSSVSVEDVPGEVIGDALDKVESEMDSLHETITEKQEELKKWRNARSTLKDHQ